MHTTTVTTIFRRVLGLSLIGLLAACASPSVRLPQDSLTRLKRIGVVSVTANTFSRQYVGVTLFGNELETKPLGAWEVNAEYERQMAAAVESVLGASAVRAPYDAAEFSRIHELNGPWENSSFWTPKWSAIEAPTLAWCKANGLDAVVVASRRKIDDSIGRSNQIVEGAGFYSRRDIHVMHLLTAVGIVDCTTGKVLAQDILRHNRGGSRNVVPIYPIPEELARAKIADWTPAMEREVQRLLVALPGTAWSDTLKQMVTGSGG